MSSSSNEGAAAHPAHAAHSSGHSRGYRVGTILAIVLTALPFWLVMSDVLHDAQTTIALIFAMALAQIVVHVVCFLHLDTRSEGGWTLLAFLFTTVIVVLTIGGSIWVMYHLNTNMMPMPGGTAGPMQ
ncbi:cytochrome o ubiquinol oxidase subunit IV [Sphingomonas nostoxanthinifaciens]|uniref:cytochrome o ubiquinol oxidase subunit IV n=1 Tax=Sphingomonas nostoxanthinifaciens TaxID=2872652 RepID=UPI001CC1CFF7|nr:cytochrome o ubiquinol oxidase subunit IV [Sphingomonas nostoxanthinifaciens]UAK23749.1 cytochrome o ubiquinol oxidase subunit IV [Sphingomonas nostoxanthinifaciens]